ncbi:protein borderless isoform X2 [Neocloeon triangulifer]|uniref:protein borderless isoform X2 n=1 Tax=Neocloeon triangulifer TaxID=2078957 RepID=UPI00286F43C2|nr:protein borderless isoform X2 [Neocloeon triangulifer]
MEKFALCSHLIFPAVAIFLLASQIYGQTVDGRKPTHLTAEIGESVLLNCEVDFPHDTVVPYILRWNKEGSLAFSWNGPEELEISPNFKGRVSRLPHNEGSSHFGRGAVNLTSIRESDQGWYECQVFFPNRNPPTRPNGTWFHLTVEGGKVMTIPPVNQTTLEGEDVNFKCVAKQSGARIIWYRDGVPIAEVPELWARSEVQGDGTLIIQRTELTDPGTFVCEVTNEAGEMQTAGAYLNVLYKAKVVNSPPEQFLTKGQPGLLDCHFRANPPLTYLKWEKDGFLYDPYNVPGVFLLHNGSLAFDNVDQGHAGMYTCTPFNDLGSAGSSSPMKVVVQQPPMFTVRPASLYVRRVGNSVKMHCAAESDDFSNQNPLVVTWFRKDGTGLPNGRYMLESGNLTIRSLIPGDSGIYICTVANEAASLTAEAELVVEEGALKAPHSLSASSTEDSVLLKWSSSETRMSQQILVWFRLVSTDEWRTMKVENNVFQATVENLIPGSLYELMVSSRDPHGEGLMSKTVRIHTKGEKPDSFEKQDDETETNEGLADNLDTVGAGNGPSNVSVRAVSAPSWLVTWKDDSKPSRLNSHNKKYTVRWRTMKDGTNKERVIDTNDRWILVNGLEEGEIYVFEVEAHGSRVQRVTEVSTQKVSSAQMLALSVLVGFIVLLTVAIASWHAGKSCGNKSPASAPPEDHHHIDSKRYGALMSGIQASPDLPDNIWMPPNNLPSNPAGTGSPVYARAAYD